NRCRNRCVLAESFRDKSRPEDEGILTLQARTPLGWMLEPQHPALPRMDVFKPYGGREIDEHLDQAVDGHACCRRTAQQRFHVFWRVIDGPRLAIDRLPLLLAHSR